MPTRNVVLTERQSALIDELVRSGEYQNASEVLREGVRLVEQRRAENAAKLQALREAAKQGIEAIEAGDFLTFTDGEAIRRYVDDLTERVIGQAKSG